MTNPQVADFTGSADTGATPPQRSNAAPCLTARTSTIASMPSFCWMTTKHGHRCANAQTMPFQAGWGKLLCPL